MPSRSATSASGLSGTLVGADVDALDVLTYGIQGGAGDLIQPGYNISKAGDFGTLYINSATGAYLFVPNAAAIEALDDGETDSDLFTVTVTDGTATVTQDYTGNVSGADDAPPF